MSQAGFVGCHHFGAPRQGRRAGRAPGTARRCCSTRRTPPDEVWDAPARAGAAADHRPAAAAVRHRRRRASPARPACPGAPTRSCRPASSRSPGCCRARRRIEQVKAADPQDLRPARPGGRAPQRGGRRRAPSAHCTRSPVPAAAVDAARACPPVVPADAPEFVRTVTAAMMAGRGDALPVSALPVDGTFPSGTTAYEKRRISDVVAEWDPDTCIQCGNCTLRLPAQRHPRQVLRRRRARRAHPEGFVDAPLNAVGLPRRALHAAGLRRGLHRLRPVRRGLPGEPAGRPAPARRSTSTPLEPQLLEPSGATSSSSRRCPVNDRSRVDFGTVRGTQFLQPLFEFSGACAGCGETPYLKLLTQLFGERRDRRQRHRLLVDLRRQPADHAVDEERRRARAGLVELAVRGQRRVRPRPAAGRRPAHRAGPRAARTSCATSSAPSSPTPSSTPGRCASPSSPAQRERVAELTSAPGRRSRARWSTTCAAWPTTCCGAACGSSAATAGPTTSAPAGSTTCWPPGATSTSSCSTPRSTPTPAASRRSPRRSAPWPSSPRPARPSAKKDLALQAIAYGNVYVARVAMGADPQQTLTAFREAEAYDGPSLDHRLQPLHRPRHRHAQGPRPAVQAVASGHWPLVRYDPTVRARGRQPVPARLARARGSRCADYIYNELRYRMLRNARSRRGRAAAGAGPGGGQPALADLRGDGHPRRAAASRPTPGSGTRATGRAGIPSRSSTRRWHGDDLGQSQAEHAATAARSACGPASTSRRAISACRCATRSSPARRPRRARWTGSRPSPTPGWGRSCCPPSTRSRCIAEELRDDRLHRAVRGRPRGGAGLLPVVPGTQLPGATWRYLSLVERGRRRGRHPRHRQPQRQQRRRLDRLRRPDGGRRRGRARAQHLLRARRPAHLGARGRGPARRDPASGQGRCLDPGRGEAEPAFQLHRRDGAAAGRGRRRRARALQPVPAPRRRPGDSRRHAGRRAVHAGGSTAGRARGSPSSPGRCAPRWPRRRVSRAPATWRPTCSPEPTSS